MNKADFFSYAVGVFFRWPNVNSACIESVQGGWQISVSFGERNTSSLVVEESSLDADIDWSLLIAPLRAEIFGMQGLA